jgi:hypothetical protein
MSLSPAREPFFISFFICATDFTAARVIAHAAAGLAA